MNHKSTRYGFLVVAFITRTMMTLYGRNNHLFRCLALATVLGCICADPRSETHPLPKGIHLSLSNDPSEMVVVWGSHYNVSNQVEVPTVEGHKNVYQAAFILDTYIAGEPHFWNKAVITGLKPDTKKLHYFPKNGDYNTGYNKEGYSFSMWPSDFRDWTPTFLLQNSLHMKAPLQYGNLRNEVMDNEYHGVFDIGVNLCGSSLYHLMWNASYLAAYTPYFPAPGRDGDIDQFVEYKRCFAMPGKSWPMEDLWYSFDVPGFAHVISFNTEGIYVGIDHVKEMVAWMEKDLKEANGARNRQEQPWIIAIASRPLYCSVPKCEAEAAVLRQQIEETLYYGGVDLVLQAADTPNYERSWPVFQGGVKEESYLHPHSPVYVNSGAFMCNSKANTGIVTELEAKDLWSAKKLYLSTVPTFGKFQLINKTHLSYEEWTADDKPKRIDQFYITQFHHGPFGARIGHRGEIIGISVMLALVLAGGLALFLLRNKIRKLWNKRQESNREVHYAQMNTNPITVA